MGRMQLRYGPNRAGFRGIAAADRRPAEAPEQGELPADGGDRLGVHPRAVPRRVHGARDVLRDPVRARLGGRRRLHPRPGRRPRHRAHPHLRRRLDRRVRLHPRRLVVRLEVRAPRLDADVRAARLVRGLARALRPRRRDHGRDALAHRDRRGAGRHALVRGPAVRRARRLPARGDRRDGPRAVRPARGRAGARRRLPHGVRRDALRPLLDVRVHQPDHALGALRDALPRRLARPRLGRRDVGGAALVHREARAHPLRVHLDADDAAAPALRPAHALRLEGAAARRDDQRA